MLLITRLLFLKDSGFDAFDCFLEPLMNFDRQARFPVWKVMLLLLLLIVYSNVKEEGAKTQPCFK